MKLTREIKTAILVIASILLFVWGYSFLKGKDLFNSYKTFYAQYDSVEGLSASAPVTLNGLIIGKVESITIDKNTGKLTVELQIDSDFPISRSSIASIYEPGFIAGKQIGILPNFSDQTMATDGQMLKSDIKIGFTQSLGDKLVPLQEKVQKIMGNADTLVTGINNVLDKKAQEDLRNSIAELSKTMVQFRIATTHINSLLEENKSKISGTVTNFNKISGNFAKLSDTLSKADIGKAIKSLNQSLAKMNSIMTSLESGNGSMGKMLKDEALYNNMSKTSKELELLLQDVRLYPTRYINVSLFGKKNKPYKAPNDSILNKN